MDSARLTNAMTVARVSADRHLRVPLQVAVFFFVAAFLATSSAADELDEQARLAPKYQAEQEVRLPDGTRCDLVNACQAIEIDWPHKWAEAIGQSLYYALVLEKEPAIILLTRGTHLDKNRIARCRRVCEEYGITLYVEPVRDRMR